tara:strand:+ start:30079 stop:30666 length:588 start_codon:yes stop_codon:yes gene_type:complete
MIPIDILENYSFSVKKYAKDQLILKENTSAHFFYQIKKGRVKMFNLTEDGKEFVQGYFSENQSFGEPPLFGDFEYPANAIALSKSEIYVLPKTAIIQLLKENSDVHVALTTALCNRIRYKAIIAKEVSVYPPAHRILTLLNYLKEQSTLTNLYEVTLTRQQISELTGLRVETVIKTIKKLEKQQKLTLNNRKIYV